MDKARFIEIAPLYYALAIMAALKRQPGSKALSLAGVIAAYSLHDEDDPSEPFKLLAYEPLIERAVEILQENYLIDVIEDEFGTPLFEDKPLWGQDRPAFMDDPKLPFFKYEKASDGNAWLRDALSGVNRKWTELDIKADDFKIPDTEWTPLPLDRNDPILQSAIEAIDATLKQVREDNGYNVTVPEERSYVVTSLSAASQILKTESATSVPFIRQFILEPLAKVGRRFGDAALGLLSTAAREAIIEYVKQHAPEWVAQLIRHL